MKQQKARCLTNLSQFLFEPRMFWKNRTSNDLNVETKKKIFKTQLGKKWDEVHRVYNKGFKVSELSSFSTT